jgi:predicted CoA-binding protein
MYPVSLPADTIEGDKAYHRLADVPDPVDGVVVAMVPPSAVTDVVAEAIARGIPRVWLYRGPGQKPVPADAVLPCHDNNVEVVDGACPFMFAAPVRGAHRVPRFLARGRFAA